MQRKFNIEVIIVSLATFVLLLSATISEARDLNGGFHNAVYESEALQFTPPKLNKASYSRYYRNNYYGYRSNRNYYRGNRYYRGGYRSHNYSNRYYYPRNRHYKHKYNYRYRYSH